MKKFSEIKPGDYLFFVDKKDNILTQEKVVRVGQIKSLDPDEEYIFFVPEGMKEINYEILRDSYKQSMYEDDYCYIFTDLEEAKMFHRQQISNQINDLMNRRNKAIDTHNKNIDAINKLIDRLTDKLKLYGEN